MTGNSIFLSPAFPANEIVWNFFLKKVSGKWFKQKPKTLNWRHSSVVEKKNAIQLFEGCVRITEPTVRGEEDHSWIDGRETEVIRGWPAASAQFRRIDLLVSRQRFLPCPWKKRLRGCPCWKKRRRGVGCINPRPNQVSLTPSFDRSHFSLCSRSRWVCWLLTEPSFVRAPFLLLPLKLFCSLFKFVFVLF